LGIDTAGRSGSVAVVSSGRVTSLSPLGVGQTYADSLAIEILNSLKSCGLVPKDLAGVAVSVGPGSFTGLRIAVATALGMVAGLAIPIVGVETLWAWAEALGRRPESVCPVLDAGKGLVFAARFGWEGDRLVRRAEDSVLSPERLCGLLDDPTVIWGDGAERFCEIFSREGAGRIVTLPRADWPPAAGVVALCGQERILQGKADSPAGFQVRYVREAEAEVQWRRRYEGISPRAGKR
jgi:tRNA threonylcarbamoyladenosine biosynthesis protein TsaB